MKMRVILFVVCVVGVCCQRRDKHGKVVDTPTSGTITIAVDESLKPLMEAEIKSFHNIYKNAHINTIYTGEREAISLLLTDSARLAVVTRGLDASERKSLSEKNIVPTHLKCATTGVALISNKQVRDSLMQMTDLQALLTTGKYSGTKSLPPDQVVFDQPSSGIVRFLKDSLEISSMAANCFSVHGNVSVIEYVSTNERALGLIDVSWISDGDDSTTNVFLNTIKVLALSNDSGFYKPFQAFLANGQYQLRRDVIMISREARSGLASGFMAFVASDRGQRIVLKSGLVPATMPIRIVHINNEPF